MDRWLEPFLTELNHAARWPMCPHYIAGLIGLGERKSMQPLAARHGGFSYDRLQHFISVAVGRWYDASLVELHRFFERIKSDGLDLCVK